MSDWQKGLDVSTSRVSPQWCKNRYAEGWRIFVQDIWTGGYKENAAIRAAAEPNLRAAREAGFVTAAYANANPWFSAQQSLTEAKVNAGAEWHHVDIVFVDVEIEGTTLQHAKDLCDAVEVEGKKVAFYSGHWYWDGCMGNPKDQWLLAYKIWNACANTDPAAGFAKDPWGPWGAKAVMGVQFGADRLDGVTVDYNNFDLEFFGAQSQGGDFMAALTEEEQQLILENAKFWMEKASWSGKDETRAEAAMRALGELDCDAHGTLFPRLKSIEAATKNAISNAGPAGVQSFKGTFTAEIGE